MNCNGSGARWRSSIPAIAGAGAPNRNTVGEEPPQSVAKEPDEPGDRRLPSTYRPQGFRRTERPAQAPREPDIVPPNRPSPSTRAARSSHHGFVGARTRNGCARRIADESRRSRSRADPSGRNRDELRYLHRSLPSSRDDKRRVCPWHSDDAGPPPDIGLAFRTRWALDKELRTGLRVLVIAGVLGGGWFFFMPLAGAVVVPGNLVVESNVKTIQHPTGGVVADIRVANGTRVKAGDLLVRLDATQARASLQVVSKQLDELRARIARLAAERDGRARIEFPGELAARSSDGTVQTLLASEDALFKARASARQSQRELQQGRIAQLTEEISGLETQVASRAKQLELIQGELVGVQDLYDKHLVPLARLTALQREAARIDGERGQLVSSIAETKSKIGEAELQIVRLDQDFRGEVVKDLGEAQGKEAELVERSCGRARPARPHRNPQPRPRASSINWPRTPSAA